MIKLVAGMCMSLILNLCMAQTSALAKDFVAELSDKYTVKDLNSTTQYYRMLAPLRERASFSKAVALKSIAVHSTKKSKFRERNQLIGFYAFEFPSKKECTQAMDSLLNCFPNFCISIVANKPSTGKLTPSVYIINSKTIYCIETFCEDVNEQWENVVENAIADFADKKSTIISSDCGELKWTTKSGYKK